MLLLGMIRDSFSIISRYRRKSLSLSLEAVPSEAADIPKVILEKKQSKWQSPCGNQEDLFISTSEISLGDSQT